MSRLISPGFSAYLASLTQDATRAQISRPIGYGRNVARNVAAHRGSSLTGAENTLSAYRSAIEAGAQIVETDVQLRADGVPVLMHDTNALRTTGFNKTVSTITAAEWDALQVNAKGLLGASTSYASEPAPTFDQFLTLCENRAVMFVEAKADAAVPVIISYADAQGVDKSSLVIMSFSLSALAPVPASGYQSLFLVSTLTGVNLAAVKAAGITHIGYGTDDASTAGLIAQAAQRGITCARWTINRRSDAATAFANGAVTAISDDAEYLLSATQIAYRDEFRAKRWMPGMFAHGSGVRGEFFDDGSWGYGATNIADFRSMLMGWAAPLPASHEIVFDLRYDQVTASSRWGGVVFGAATDHPYEDNATDFVNCYHCIFRQSGDMQLYKKAAGGSSVFQASFVCSTPFPVGTGAYNTIRVAVTPTAVTVTRVDTGESVSINDTQYRGGYFHFTKNGAAVRFRNVLVTRA